MNDVRSPIKLSVISKGCPLLPVSPRLKPPPLLASSYTLPRQQWSTRLVQPSPAASKEPMVPPSSLPLLHIVGMDGSTAAAQSILDGTFICPPEVDDYTRKFISSLCRPPNLPPPQTLSISAADFQSYWWWAQECTSSSYSGLHFGHYKAAASCPTLSELHAIFTQLCFANGFSPQCWQSGLQVVLEKKAGIIHIDKLFALLLMEADFNFGNKILFGH